MRTKKSLPLAIVSLSMVILVTISLIMGTIYLSKRFSFFDTYTVCDDGDYYSETTYYLNEVDYLKSLKETNVNNVQQTRATVTNVTKTLGQDEGNFVFAARKNVWVSECENEEGLITQSRLLTKSEVDELRKNEDSGILLASATSPDPGDGDNGNLPSGSTVVTPPPPDPNKKVGSDSTSLHLLSIDMNVYYNTDTEKYSVTGHAAWEAKLVWAWENYKAAEEYRLDYLGISWGGDNLVAESNKMTGVYHDNGTVTCGKKISDSSMAFVWQFNEKSGYMGKELKSGTANVVLKKREALKNKTTSVKMTYIHTYGKADTQVTVSVDKNGLAAKVALAVVEDSWQLEIDVPEILY